jgi:sarcosine oxidase
MSEFNYIIIGKGLIGSAAIRYLSKYSSNVAAIGPDEPLDQEKHEGVFASHYDQGRLTRLIDDDPIWSQLARRAIDNYGELEERSGIRFYNPVGLLLADIEQSQGGYLSNRLEVAKALNLKYTLYEPDDRRWQETFPYLNFPATYSLFHEPAPAGYINPRSLIEAQLNIARQQGATIIPQTVSVVQKEGDWIVVKTTEGATYRAKKVLVAAGAFTNYHNLLPRPIPLKVKTETIILGRLSEAEAQRLGDMPIVVYLIDDPEIENIYMTPPIQYPDGDYYIKMGANTIADQWPTTLAEIQAWFREGDSDLCKGAMERALRSQFPDVEFLSVETKRCIVCYTPSRHATIDEVGNGIFVAAGGNGRGAKGSDTLGYLAAGLIHDGSWPNDIPREPFRARIKRRK